MPNPYTYIPYEDIEYSDNLKPIDGTHSYADDAYTTRNHNLFPGGVEVVSSGMVSDPDRVRDGVLDEVKNINETLIPTMRHNDAYYREELSETKNNVTTLTQNVSDLENSVSTLNDSVSDVNEKVDEIGTPNGGVWDGKIGELDSRVSTNETSIVSTNNEVSAVKDDIRDIETRLGSYDEGNIQYIGNYNLKSDLPLATGGIVQGSGVLVGTDPSYVGLIYYETSGYTWSNTGRVSIGRYDTISQAPDGTNDTDIVLIGTAPFDLYSGDMVTPPSTWDVQDSISDFIGIYDNRYDADIAGETAASSGAIGTEVYTGVYSSSESSSFTVLKYTRESGGDISIDEVSVTDIIGVFNDVSELPEPDSGFAVVYDLQVVTFYEVNVPTSDVWEWDTDPFAEGIEIVPDTSSFPPFNAVVGAYALVHHEYEATTLAGLPVVSQGQRGVVTEGADAGNYIYLSGWNKTTYSFGYLSYFFDGTNWIREAEQGYPLASEEEHGYMPKESFQQIETLTADVENLKGLGMVAANLGTNPSQSDLEDAWDDAKGSLALEGAVIINLDQDPPAGHNWTKLNVSGTPTWVDRGLAQVDQATNTTLGIVKGSTEAGKVFVESDGSQSVNGWDTLTGEVSDNTEGIASLQSSKQNNLVSGTNIKTVGGTSLLGSGDITIPPPGVESIIAGSGISVNDSDPANPIISVDDGDFYTKEEVDDLLEEKADDDLANVVDFSNAISLDSGNILTLGSDRKLFVAGTPTPPPPPSYFTIKNATSVTPKWTVAGSDLEYSIDDGASWTSITGGTAISTGGNDIMFRGLGRQGLFTTNSSTNAWIMVGINIVLSGNLNTILDYVSPPDTLADYCYAQMFYGNQISSLSGFALPATTLANYCYYNMFYGNQISSLTGFALPATTLADSCYCGMFIGNQISSLTGFELPATTLADSCYSSMFEATQISSLTGFELPATTLATACYSNMFYGNQISSLSGFELPATTLASNCYSSMFKATQISSLTGFELPATTLAVYCYNSMFEATQISSLSGFELPATTLANYCYYRMFYGNQISSLSGFALPATTLTAYCYYGMFIGNQISSLSGFALPATTLADSCYYNMFYGNQISSLSGFALPATTLTVYCYNSMFYGNQISSLTGFALPATTLATACYSSMFSLCPVKLFATSGTGHTSQFRIPTSGTASGGSNQTTNMFSPISGDSVVSPSINTVYYQGT